MYKIVLFLIVLIFVSCNDSAKKANINEENNQQKVIPYGNSAAEGFNKNLSDDKAIEIADLVMEAMGGRQNWDNTKIISWDFFGRRKHTWNKNTGDIRIDSEADDFHVLMNINTLEGRVKMNGEEISNPDSLSKYLDLGKQFWVNDSYWLVMPFKLKDSGVTLNYIGEDTIVGGAKADVLQLTFNNVGYTPENKYLIYVDKTDDLIKQWAFYPEIKSEEPAFITPWIDYKKYGNILLSGNRGDYMLKDIDVTNNNMDSILNNF